jgi:hypothetical protein
VQAELKDQVVQHIYSNRFSFTAVLVSGRVVTWGDADFGGDSSSVQAELKDQVVKHIYSTDNAFAALLVSGRVVTWGDAISGGDSSLHQIADSRGDSSHVSFLFLLVGLLFSFRTFVAPVIFVIILSCAFSTICVAFVRHMANLGDSSLVQAELKDQVVQHIYSTSKAFAAVLASGRVVTWGDAGSGGDSSSVQAELKDQVVQHIYSTDNAFAAVLASGRVVTWGDADFGGDSSSVQAELTDQVVQHIYSTSNAFAALLASGRVVTWGD